MLACFPENLEPSRNFSSTWCGAHINTRKAALYWVSHTKKHIEVFLRCDDSPEIIDAIRSKLPSGVELKQRPHPRKGIAISTPLFFFVYTEEQAHGMGPLLELLASNNFAPKIERTLATHIWAPNSEVNDSAFEATVEGNKVTVTVSRYERKPANRKKCIQHYGPICFVCGFDFSVTYGKIGKGHIHVHHLTQLSDLGGKAQKFDPVRDLRPVCPNCHEMLHKKNPPYEIEELKSLIAKANV